MTTLDAPRFVVAMLGARMHYAIPRILHQAGLLETLFTDWCVAGPVWRWLPWLPSVFRSAALRRLAQRRPAGLPDARIRQFPTLGARYFFRRRRARNNAQLIAAYLEANRRFGQLVTSRSWGAANSVFVFNTAGYEILSRARQRGLRTVLEQSSAPVEIEDEILAAESARLGIEYPIPPVRREFGQRERAEWALADTIVCGSEWVRAGIARCGGPAERCVVVPYGVDARAIPAESRTGSKMRVLVVGNVRLQKGSHHIAPIARRLADCAEFRVVGPILELRPDLLAELRAAADCCGAVPRDELPAHYAWADVLLMPSLCEGSATVTYEALAAGLPVVATPNSGSVVRDQQEGFLVPAGDIEQFARRLRELAEQPALRTRMALAARARGAEFTVDSYGTRLLGAVGLDPTIPVVA